MILVTGSGGLIGNSVSNFFLKKNIKVIGIDNNQRKKFFGKNGDVIKNIIQLKKNKKFKHKSLNILDKFKLEKLFKKNKFDIIIHSAAQPSHDWSASDPVLDFLLPNFSQGTGRYCFSQRFPLPNYLSNQLDYLT